MLRTVFTGLLSAIAIAATVSTAGAATRPRVLVEHLPGAAIQQVQLAKTPQRDLKLRVISVCDDGMAVFKVFNDGEPWPEAGTLGIYKVSGGKAELVSRRTMRLAEGQQASFRVRKPGDDTLALFVEPNWYKREFTRDAEVICK